RLAKAGVGIDDKRQSAGPREIGRLLGQLGEREQADVRQAEQASGKRCAGKIDRVVAAALDETGEEGARGAGHLNGGLGDEIAELFAGGGQLSVVSGQVLSSRAGYDDRW